MFVFLLVEVFGCPFADQYIADAIIVCLIFIMKTVKSIFLYELTCFADRVFDVCT